MTTYACHVITTTSLLNLYVTTRTLLQLAWETIWWGFATLCIPLMLADKTHHRVKSKVTEAHATNTRTIYLYVSRVELVPLELCSTAELTPKLLCVRRDLQRKLAQHCLLATGAYAPKVQLPRCPTPWHLLACPTLPT